MHKQDNKPRSFSESSVGKKSHDSNKISHDIKTIKSKLDALNKNDKEKLKQYIKNEISIGATGGTINDAQTKLDEIKNFIKNIRGSKIDENTFIGIAKAYFDNEQKSKDKKIAEETANRNLQTLLNGQTIINQDYTQDQSQKTTTEQNQSVVQKEEDKKMSGKEMAIRSIASNVALTLFVFAIAFVLPHIGIPLLIKHLAISGFSQLLLSGCGAVFAIVFNIGPVGVVFIAKIKKIFKVDQVDKQLRRGSSIEEAKSLAKRIGKDGEKVSNEIEKRDSTKNKIKWLMIVVCILCLAIPALFVAKLTLPLLCLVAFAQFSIFVGGLVVTPLVLDAIEARKNTQKVKCMIDEIGKELNLYQSIKPDDLKMAIMHQLLTDRITVLEHNLSTMPKITDFYDKKSKLTKEIEQLKFITDHATIDDQSKQAAYNILSRITPQQYEQLVQANSDKLGLVASACANFVIKPNNNTNTIQSIEDKKKAFSDALLPAIIDGEANSICHEAICIAFDTKGQNNTKLELRKQSITQKQTNLGLIKQLDQIMDQENEQKKQKNNDKKPSFYSLPSTSQKEIS